MMDFIDDDDDALEISDTTAGATAACVCGRVQLKFHHACCFRLECGCVDCRQAAEFAAHRGGPTCAPISPLAYFTNDVTLAAEDPSLVKLERLRSKDCRSTRLVTKCCHSTLAVDHPAYARKLVMVPAQSCVLSGDGVGVQPLARIYMKDYDETADGPPPTPTPPTLPVIRGDEPDFPTRAMVYRQAFMAAQVVVPRVGTSLQQICADIGEPAVLGLEEGTRYYAATHPECTDCGASDDLLRPPPGPPATDEKTLLTADVLIAKTTGQEEGRTTIGERLRAKLIEQRCEADAELRQLAEEVRTAFVGDNSAWQCDLAARQMVEEIQRRKGFEARLGHGSCSVGRGAFVGGNLPQTPAWPGKIIPVPQSGAPHTFVVFADGAILDVTADQFDPELPRVWWPADVSRYRVGAKANLWGAIAEHEQRQEREAATKEALEREWWNWGC